MPWDDWAALEDGTGRHASPRRRPRPTSIEALAILFGDGSQAPLLLPGHRARARVCRPSSCTPTAARQKLLYVERRDFPLAPAHGSRPTTTTRSTSPPWTGASSSSSPSLQAARGDPRAVRASDDRRRRHRAGFSPTPGERPHQRLRARAAGRPLPLQAALQHQSARKHERGNTAHILIDEQMRAGHLKHGHLCMMLALGSRRSLGLRRS